VSGAVSDDLRELLGFRHFFRHAYAAALRPRRMEELGRILLRAHDGLAHDLDAFERFLDALAAMPVEGGASQPVG
jgi:hypothetical protein